MPQIDGSDDRTIRRSDPTTDFEPRRPALLAAAVFILAALTLCWPMLTGDFLVGPGSDQYEAGYSFRHFAARYFREHHSIPQWNPYLFGGLPFIGAAHGDIFYPTAWLRWFLPTDVGMNLGFAIHIVLAGVGAYSLMRTLRTTWGGAVAAGLAYELTGIVISLVRPGHDGKLFVSAMAPFLLLGIVRAVRDRSWTGFGVMALTIGLALQGHPQAAMYLIVAAAIWGLFWLLGPEGPRTGIERIKTAGLAVGAVALGVGLYAIYALPMAEYVPFSPRSEGGFNSGWEYAKSFALPRSELLGALLPKIDGGAGNTYFGMNGLKLHSEYLGPVTLLLAAIGIGGSERRRVRIALGTIAVTFLLVSLGDGTPFFRLWYEVMPLASRLRAPGMAFFLVSLPLACLAGFGAERLFRGVNSLTRVWVVAGLFGFLALLGILGILQSVAQDIAFASRYQGAAELAIANAPALRLDSIRLLVVTLIGTGLIAAIAKRRLVGIGAIATLAVVVFADLVSVGRGYFQWSPGAKVTYAADEVMQHLQQTPAPYRALAPAGVYEGLNPYPKSWLMAAGIPVLFGYHGNEIRFFDDVLGGKNDWRNQLNRKAIEMFAIRYLILNQEQDVPGFTKVLGPVEAHRGQAYLYQADSIPPYARVLAGAVKVPEDQLAVTAADPRFPVDRLAIYPDTASVSPAPLDGQLPEPSSLTAEVTEWEPGRIKVAVSGQSDQPQYLVVAENWYPDWHPTVDGRDVPLLRAQNTLLSVVLPPGAREVVFRFDSAAYRKGKLISLASLLGVVGLFAVPLVRRKRPDG